jgi:membrane protease subunit HflC
VPRFVTITIAGIFFLILALFMCTFTVRFTESAVLTTFGKAGEGAIKNAPGLYFKAPYPFQNYVKYDTRTRYLQARSETQQTDDSRQIIVESFALWRVTDPLKFFQSFSNAGDRAIDHYRKAEEIVRGNLRSALSATSRFRLDQLFAASGGDGKGEGSKLPQLEAAVLASLNAKDPSGASLSDYGLSVIDVGISRILLPESTTQAVNERMGANRDRLASELESQGESIAEAIRSQAKADAQRITAFAERRAQEIRTRGDLEAAEYLKQMQVDPELAVYLENVNFMKDVLARRVTLVVPTTMPGFSLLQPSALDGLKAGQLPALPAPQSWIRTPAADDASKKPAAEGAR